MVLFPLRSRWWQRWSEKPVNVNSRDGSWRIYSQERPRVSLPCLQCASGEAAAGCMASAPRAPQSPATQPQHVQWKRREITTHSSSYLLTAFKGCPLPNFKHFSSLMPKQSPSLAKVHKLWRTPMPGMTSKTRQTDLTISFHIHTNELRWEAMAEMVCNALPDATCHHAQLHTHCHNLYISDLSETPDVKMPIHQAKHPERYTFAD